MEVAHFLTGRAVAFVYADRLYSGVVDWGKFESHAILDVTAMA